MRDAQLYSYSSISFFLLLSSLSRFSCGFDGPASATALRCWGHSPSCPFFRQLKHFYIPLSTSSSVNSGVLLFTRVWLRYFLDSLPLSRNQSFILTNSIPRLLSFSIGRCAWNFHVWLLSLWGAWKESCCRIRCNFHPITLSHNTL